jgi:hypothetical protein
VIQYGAGCGGSGKSQADVLRKSRFRSISTAICSQGNTRTQAAANSIPSGSPSTSLADPQHGQVIFGCRLETEADLVCALDEKKRCAAGLQAVICAPAGTGRPDLEHPFRLQAQWFSEVTRNLTAAPLQDLNQKIDTLQQMLEVIEHQKDFFFTKVIEGSTAGSLIPRRGNPAASAMAGRMNRASLTPASRMKNAPPVKFSCSCPAASSARRVFLRHPARLASAPGSEARAAVGRSGWLVFPATRGRGL